jgi:chromosome segregation ATPase
MSNRGITENDVWQACDALLLEGARPTIERVRQKIGRGSPNTVSPHLDAWFRRLGGRLQSPEALAASTALPEPVQVAAARLWEVAQAETRSDFDQRLQAAMAEAVAHIEAEKARSAQAEASTSEVNAHLHRLKAELIASNSALESEKWVHASTAAHLQGARQQIEDLKSRLDSAQQAFSALTAQVQVEVAAAHERSAGAERRAAMEIDGERTMRSKAEKRMEALERRWTVSQTDLVTERSRRVEVTTQLQADLARARDDLAHALQSQGLATLRIEELAGTLHDAQRRTEVAEARAELGERVLERLRPPSSATKSRSTPQGRKSGPTRSKLRRPD